MIRFNRRLFLGGSGALVALPSLESLISAQEAQKTAPPSQRFLVFYVPNGLHVRDWLPEATGQGFDLKPALMPLESVRDQISVVSGLTNASAEEGEDGDHARGTGTFLTCTRILKSESRLRNAISLDQLLVQKLEPKTRFNSLQLGIEGGSQSGGCDADYSCAYQRNISWAGPASPLPKIISPSALFERMFAGTDVKASAAEVGRRQLLRKSVLDTVRVEARELQSQVDFADRRKLDEYLTGLRELELRITPAVPAGSCAAALPSANEHDDPRRHTRAMLDLMVTAFSCDLSRVITFMLANSGSDRSFQFAGVDGSHHEVSHHDDDPENLRKYRAIATWQVEQFAYLVGRLKAIPDGDGTLLDQCLLFFSTEISDGNKHDHQNLPVILAGSAGGAIQPGRHLRAAEREPIANLYLSFLRAFSASAETFGSDGAHPLAEL